MTAANLGPVPRLDTASISARILASWSASGNAVEQQGFACLAPGSDATEKELTPR